MDDSHRHRCPYLQLKTAISRAPLSAELCSHYLEPGVASCLVLELFDAYRTFPLLCQNHNSPQPFLKKIIGPSRVISFSLFLYSKSSGVINIKKQLCLLHLVSEQSILWLFHRCTEPRSLIQALGHQLFINFIDVAVQAFHNNWSFSISPFHHSIFWA